MKRIFYTLTALLLSWETFGQAPENMTYQSVIRDASNELVVASNISVYLTINKGSASGMPVYEEGHNVLSNDNGLITFVIGDGSNPQGNIATIDWEDGPYFLDVAIDPTGGSTYSLNVVTQFMSVPYALHAKTAATANSVNMEIDDLSDVNSSSATSGDVLSFDGSNWVPAASGAASPWTVNSGNIYRNSGNVGINTVNPEFPLSLLAQGTYGPDLESVGMSLITVASSADGIWENEGIRSEMMTDNFGGRAISGKAFGSNSGTGVYGQSATPDARGVMGFAFSSVGDNSSKIGVFGQSTASAGTPGEGDHTGVMGISVGNGDRSYGVVGESYGIKATGFNMGVVGFGRASVGNWSVGVYGEPLVLGADYTFGTIGANNLVQPTGYNTGLYGTASGSGQENYGIDGTSSGNTGVNYGTTGWAFGTGNVNYAIYGQVGTTGSTNYAGYFEGDVHVTGTFTNPSDRKLKTNIKEVKSTTEQLMNLGVYNYTYKEDGLNLPKGLQYGFIAQEVETYFPELVKQEVGMIHDVEEVEGPNGNIYLKKIKTGEEHYKAVNYIGLIPVVTKSLQEQVLRINNLEEENQKLNKRLSELEALILEMKD